MDMIHVYGIPKAMVKPWLLEKHYAKRIPPMQYTYGLYKGKHLEGVIVYGPTQSIMLNNGYAAFGCDKNCKEYCPYSFELLRLVIDSDIKNAASILVGRSLRVLPTPAFLVSYADGNIGRVGYVYQATNWIYTGKAGMSKVYRHRETGKTYHSRTVAGWLGETLAKEAIPDWLEEVEEEPNKHRYIQLLGSKTARKEMRKHLTYPSLPYPKGDSKRFDAGPKFETQALLFE